MMRMRSFINVEYHFQVGEQEKLLSLPLPFPPAPIVKSYLELKRLPAWVCKYLWQSLIIWFCVTPCHNCLTFFNLVVSRRFSETFDMTKNPMLELFGILLLLHEAYWDRFLCTKVHSWVEEHTFTLTVKVASGWRYNTKKRKKLKLFPLASWEKKLNMSSQVNIFPWCILKYLFHSNCAIWSGPYLISVLIAFSH